MSVPECAERLQGTQASQGVSKVRIRRAESPSRNEALMASSTTGNNVGDITAGSKMLMFSQILASHEQLSNWAKWLVNSTSTQAVELRVFLDRALRYLPEPNKVRQRLQRADAKGVDAILHELLMFKVCTILRMNPTFEPNVGEQHPDLSICIEGKPFLADVVVASRPISTMHTAGDGYHDRGQAAKKLADRVAEKASKYARLNQPLIVFVMFGGYDIGFNDLETALYGSTVQEAGVSSEECHPDSHGHGILCPPSENPHPLLSATIGCQWFPSLTRNGRRLHCVVYHHWQPRVPLPLGAFGLFSDLHWRFHERDLKFIPEWCGEPNIVMSTGSDDPPHFAPYSSDNPW